MANSYEPHVHGLADVGRSRAMGQAMAQAAGRGQRYAETNAPRDSGDYSQAFRIEPATVPVGWRNEKRAGAALVNDAPYALAVEGRARVMQRAVDAIEKDLGW